MSLTIVRQIFKIINVFATEMLYTSKNISDHTGYRFETKNFIFRLKKMILDRFRRKSSFFKVKKKFEVIFFFAEKSKHH